MTLVTGSKISFDRYRLAHRRLREAPGTAPGVADHQRKNPGLTDRGSEFRRKPLS
jgi:hypothetical protein